MKPRLICRLPEVIHTPNMAMQQHLGSGWRYMPWLPSIGLKMCTSRASRLAKPNDSMLFQKRGSHVHHQHSQNNESFTSTPNAHTIRTVATPSTTTTTSIVSSKVRNSGNASRRLSSWTTTPMPNRNTASNRQSTSSPLPSQQPSTFSKDSDASDPSLQRQSSKDSDRRKSKMNFGDVGGIRRVFLRKRNDR